MAQASTFPVFGSVDFDNRGFRDFRVEAAETGNYVKRQFERDMADVQATVAKALTLPRGAGDAFQFDTKSIRQSAVEAERSAQALRLVAKAAEEVARETGDMTAATRRHIQTTQAAAAAQEEEARALNAKAAMYERLQDQINRSGTQIAGYTGANRRLAESQRAVQQASVGAGQQLQDIAISLYGGQKAGVVFAQQLPQLAFALTALEGSSNKTAASVGRFATFLSGPWGLAVGLGVGVLATLTARLFENADAADVAEDAHKALEKRLADMETFFDLATGAINRQNEALIANARLKRLDEIDALKGTQKDRSTEIKRLVTSSGEERFENAGSIADPLIRSIGRDTTIIDAINRNKGDQKAISDALLTIARGGGDNAAKARRILDLRGEAFSANADVRELSLEEESLASGKLAKELMKGKKAPRARSTRGGADRELRAARAIEDAVDSAAAAVANLRSQFDQAPSDIDKATKASEDLDKIMKQIERRETDGKRTKGETTKDEETKRQIEDFERLKAEYLKRPIEDRIKASERELELQRLVLSGREDEADILSLQYDIMRQLGVETEEQLRRELKGRGISYDRYQLLVQQREQMIAMEKAQERLDRAVKSTGSKLSELDRAYDTIIQGVAGLPKDAVGALEDVVSSLKQQVYEIVARRITDSLFGNLFTRLEDQIRGSRPIDVATEGYVESTAQATVALQQLTDSFTRASTKFNAANDNRLAGQLGIDGGSMTSLAEIVVSGTRSSIARTRQQEQADETKRLNKNMDSLLKNLATGAFTGQTASSLIFGKKGSATGSAIGGALGQVAGEAIGKTLGGLAGKFAGPLGSIAGGLLGSVVGGLLKKTKVGSATIGVGADGQLAIASYGGNSQKFKDQAGKGGDSVISTIESIAEQLGASVNAGRGSVSIGVRDGKIRVDTSGKGITKVKKGAVDFGDDSEAAIRYATMDLIKDGVLEGLKASTQRLLQQAKDLDAGLKKALDFESVFSRLKEYEDPVGAALDGLDKEFTRLQKIFTEAGASAAEFADLERLYGLERAKAIEEATNSVAGSLKDLYSELTVGNNGKSLRDRLSAAQAAYDPLAARVASGDRSAYDAFAKAAQDLLGIQREFSGSQSPYFNLLDEVTRLTKTALDRETNIISLATDRDSPFTSSGTVEQSYTPVVSAIQQQTQDLLRGFALIAGGGGGSLGNGFLSERML
ncbi:MAG: hypothetical protein J0H88_13885 [Sphingomonadales bacterium]|nr:hypothetical protein [Sphingomonadales bacterium]